jgi:hypothetical protein
MRQFSIIFSVKLVLLLTIGFFFLVLSSLVATPVQAAPDIKVIEQKVKQNTAARTRQLSSPTVDSDGKVLGKQDLISPLPLSPVYKEIIITSWFGGLIQIRDVSGQLYLTIFR